LIALQKRASHTTFDVESEHTQRFMKRIDGAIEAAVKDGIIPRGKKWPH